jgi:hypothetical protein|tara:strand:- start:1498 stop:1713 length:216 start_codon:yes stop_codon:yes gene_type:complete
MTKGTNFAIYHFKVTDLDESHSRYYFTAKDIHNTIGIPRSTTYYSLKTRNGKCGKYLIEKCYIPKPPTITA